MSLVLDEHRQYIADPVRLDAFSRALASTVKPGDVVLDIGSGTGILALMACRAGAARVYAIESQAIAGLARQLAAANGFGDKVIVVRDLSTHIVLPELADVAVMDLIGPFGFDAGLVEPWSDARARLLKPGGCTIPARVALFVAPCRSPRVRAAVDTWASRPQGFDFGVVRDMACSTAYGDVIEAGNLLAAPATVAVLEASSAASQRFVSSVEFEIARDGPADALAGWFEAELAGGVVLTNAPDHPAGVARRHFLFPLDPAPAVAMGDRLRVELRIWPVDLFVSWQVEWWRRGEAAPQRLSRQSTFGGMMISHEDLGQARELRPELNASGRARLSILELADGAHTIEDIERCVFERHPDAAPTREAAAALVARVLSCHAE